MTYIPIQIGCFNQYNLQCMIQNELLLALTANHVPCEMVKQNFITALYVNVGVTLKFHLHLFNIY
jgi:hypothetical protein